jgi:hypothetical protein
MIDNFNINIRKTLLALVVCLISIPLARFISPLTLVDGIRFSCLVAVKRDVCVIFIFGRYAIAPLIVSFAITNHLILPLTALQSVLLLFCQLFSAGILRDCQNADWQNLAQWADGKTYGDADFLGRFFCTGVNETDDVSGWCNFFRWLSLAISKDASDLYHLIYKA